MYIMLFLCRRIAVYYFIVLQRDFTPLYLSNKFTFIAGKTNNFSHNNYFYIRLDWLLYFSLNSFLLQDNIVGSCCH